MRRRSKASGKLPIARRRKAPAQRLAYRPPVRKTKSRNFAASCRKRSSGKPLLLKFSRSSVARLSISNLCWKRCWSGQFAYVMPIGD